MAGRRVPKLNEQFRREITGILRTEVRDPRIGVPTVTAVEVTSDLWMARIFVRPDPVPRTPDDEPEPAEKTLEGKKPAKKPAGKTSAGKKLIADLDPGDALLQGLVGASPFIRRELGRRLPLRRVPELRFEIDRSLEHAIRIESLLRSVRPADEVPDDVVTNAEVPGPDVLASDAGLDLGPPSGEPDRP